ncbi:MAG: DUF1404 domain-containing protein [Candidatus Marsarchaeota archaeon]|nr:DUF1404 domain-containing protein [Candidatus Marsarchaeota archaeon]
MSGLSPKSKITAIAGVALIVGAANPLIVGLEPSSMVVKVFSDSMILFAGGLLGYSLYEWFMNSNGRAGGLAYLLYRLAQFLKGIVLVWVVPSAIVVAWYTPRLVTLSLSSPPFTALEVASMTFGGVVAGFAWGSMSRTMRSVTLFMIFFMSGTMGELLTEEGGSNVFFPAGYPYYSQSQVLYTGYMMWLISLIPVTFYAVKFLKDMGMF